MAFQVAGSDHRAQAAAAENIDLSAFWHLIPSFCNLGDMNMLCPGYPTISIELCLTSDIQDRDLKALIQEMAEVLH